MRDSIITRKPSLPNGRRTDIALFAVCFLFLLFFSAFVVAPPQVWSERTNGVLVNSDGVPTETATEEEGGSRSVPYAEKSLLVAGASSSEGKRMTARR
ncbi:MAG: hypothetical protein HY788_12725 [Deltaproteobacteria bacterium]|nr:hypothetical protein [Deltaproteobacteria bacterium]